MVRDLASSARGKEHSLPLLCVGERGERERRAALRESSFASPSSSSDRSPSVRRSASGATYAAVGNWASAPARGCRSRASDRPGRHRDRVRDRRDRRDRIRARTRGLTRDRRDRRIRTRGRRRRQEPRIRDRILGRDPRDRDRIPHRVRTRAPGRARDPRARTRALGRARDPRARTRVRGLRARDLRRPSRRRPHRRRRSRRNTRLRRRRRCYSSCRTRRRRSSLGHLHAAMDAADQRGNETPSDAKDRYNKLIKPSPAGRRAAGTAGLSARRFCRLQPDL